MGLTMSELEIIKYLENRQVNYNEIPDNVVIEMMQSNNY